ncbi:serine hydrolase domain-containing protein [Streptomyces sp. NPDC093252]|uniref:serine hydrolase domain-containing protein n=1 Tax=Streptomyces sp. NPDC093252 TaxID=3154980 RepID=UPI00341518CF
MTSGRRSRGLLCAVLLLLATLLAPAASATPAAPTPAAPTPAAPTPSPTPSGTLDPDLTARLDRAIADVQREAAIPGVVVGLWMPGKGDYVRATGVADKATGQPMADDLYVRIGSETKTFTVTALLQLVDQGRVGLDDPVSRYVPGVPDGDRITLRQLAGMRSGLFPYTSDPGFDHTLLSDPDRRFTPRELLAYGFKHPNTFAPGAKFQYSNTNLILLGLVVEKVTGRPVGEVIEERVVAPAGLRHTLFPDNAAIPDPHPQGYTNQTLNGSTTVSTNWDPTWAWSAGAMISTLDDLRSWARTVATGTLLTPATQAERLATLPTGVPGTGYGLGIFDSGGWIGHNGSIPGYETVTVYLPAERATLVVMLNTDITYRGQEPSSLVARAVTQVVTPDHVYGLPVQGR